MQQMRQLWFGPWSFACYTGQSGVCYEIVPVLCVNWKPIWITNLKRLTNEPYNYYPQSLSLLIFCSSVFGNWQTVRYSPSSFPFLHHPHSPPGYTSHATLTASLSSTPTTKCINWLITKLINRILPHGRAWLHTRLDFWLLEDVPGWSIIATISILCSLLTSWPAFPRLSFISSAGLWQFV